MSFVLIVFLNRLSGQEEFQHTSFTPVNPEILSNSVVRCFYKDSEGFMWFGTNEGLLRYDGTNIYSYKHNPNDDTSISNNSINVIIEDVNNKLWIGTAWGLCSYNREKDNFVNVDKIKKNKNHLNNISITSLSSDSLGDLWIGTHGGGVNVYNPKDFRFIYLNDEKASEAKNYINSLLRVDNQMWIATKNGLVVFDTKNKVPASVNIKGKLPSNELTALSIDRYRNIWIGTLTGDIFKVSKNTTDHTIDLKFSNNTSSDQNNWNTILTMVNDSKGNLWVAGENSGLNYLNVNSKKNISFGLDKKTNAIGLSTNSIQSLYIDDKGLIWIGTYNKGVFIINNSVNKFNDYDLGDFNKNQLINREIKSFSEDKQGNVWIACEGIGLIKIESKTGKLKHSNLINEKIKNVFITSLKCDSSGNLWIGSRRNGVYKVNLSSFLVTNYRIESNGFGDNNIYCIYEDKNQVLWVGSGGSGLFYYNNDKQIFNPLIEEDKANHIPKNSYVTSILEDSLGSLWVGTLYGLFRLKVKSEFSFDYESFYQWSNSANLSSNSIQSLFEDANSNLWIGTIDNGINVLNNKGHKKVTYYNKEDGLPSNIIRGIVQDFNKDLWISTNMGLSKFNKIKNTFTKYTKVDGLASNNLYGNSCLISNTGKLFFGGNNGMNIFYPDSIKKEIFIPKIYLTDLKINNKSVEIGTVKSPLTKHINQTKNISLSHLQRSFTIDFAAINYGQSFSHNYCYKLEGFDDNWNCLGLKNSATYTNIDPGNYVFLVTTKNDEGVLNKMSKRLDITIHQVFWKTWWAIILYVLIFTTVLFFVVKIQTEKINFKNQLVLERLASEKEQDLIKSKTHFFTNISHEFRTPLSLIIMPLEKLIGIKTLPDTAKNRLKIIQRNSNKMLALVNELMDFSKMESAKLNLNIQRGDLVSFIMDIYSGFSDFAVKKNIDFKINVIESSIDGWFDYDRLEMIMDNLLSNAFKFTGINGKICVNVDLIKNGSKENKTNKRTIQIQVVDSGIGIPEKELPFIFEKFYQVKSASKIINSGTGIGLSLSKGLVELHHGTIKVESEKKSGTIFIVEIPIDKNCYSSNEIIETETPVSENVKKLNISTHKSTVEYLQERETAVYKPKVLIVEDNDELREYLALELEQFYNVIEAINGLQALEIAKNNNLDLIISDIMMPIKSGIELCEEIKANVETSHIPIILLTAKASIENQISGINTGADVYITKPFNIQFLIAQIDQIIEARQKLYAKFSQNVYLLPSKVAKNRIDQEFLQRVIDYVIENIQNSEIGVKQIAEILNLSNKQFYRKIKALTGKPVVNFITMIRVKEALKLMGGQEYTLKEIAYMTGFNSASYFTTCFKNIYGKAPSEFLEKKGGNQ